jgi:transposase
MAPTVSCARSITQYTASARSDALSHLLLCSCAAATGCDRLPLLFACAQVQCVGCGHWMSKAKACGHKLCLSCRHPPAAAAAATPAPPAPSPPPPLSDHDPHSHGHLGLEQRVAIRVLHAEGRDDSYIAARIPCDVRTVRHWLAHYEQHHDVQDERRSGRPRLTDEATDTALAFVSRVEPFATPRGLKRKLQLDVSIDTIDRRLKEAGLPGRVARHVFQLSDDHKRQRLSFAHGYESKTEDDWRHVLFADIKTFAGEGRHGQVWVRRPVGEAADPQYTVAHKPHPVAVPAWGCFSAHGPGYMAMFDGSLDAAGLRDIFRDYLLPTVEEHFGEGADWWLLHDNDPGRHHSQVLRRFMHDHYIRPLDFPPYSPDLNPIENVWREMDVRMATEPASTKEQLEALVQATWASLTPDYCSGLARSMPKRIAQVIERKGAYTDY